MIGHDWIIWLINLSVTETLPLPLSICITNILAQQQATTNLRLIRLQVSFFWLCMYIIIIFVVWDWLATTNSIDWIAFHTSVLIYVQRLLNHTFMGTISCLYKNNLLGSLYFYFQTWQYGGRVVCLRKILSHQSQQLLLKGMRVIFHYVSSLDLTIDYAGRVYSRIRFWAVLHRLNARYLQYWVNQVTQ